jgi:predicted unusual protein kinase regulating ubiquinone biosynthesis (AarF/ABC1/UbiB family)
MAILSGMCTGLDPAFDMWKELEPFAQKLVASEALPIGRQLLGEVGKIASALVALPGKVDRVLDQADRGGLTARTPDLSRQVQRLEQGLNRLLGGIIFAALLLGGVQLELGGRQAFGVALLVGAGLTLVSLIWPRRR